MRSLDLHWMDKEEWIDFSGEFPKVRDDAPEEAKKSFRHYEEQTKENKSA